MTFRKNGWDDEVERSKREALYEMRSIVAALRSDPHFYSIAVRTNNDREGWTAEDDASFDAAFKEDCDEG